MAHYYDPDDDEFDIEAEIEPYLGTEEGDCMFCGGSLTMKNKDNVCFSCVKCKQSIDYEGYLLWLAGHEITFEE